MVENIEAVFSEYQAEGVEITQPLVRQSWGLVDFKIVDPDGNSREIAEPAARAA